MNTQKLRDMNLHAVADEMEQLRAFKAEVENQEPDCWRITHRSFCGIVTDKKEIAEDPFYSGCVFPLYAKPVPADKPARITEQDAREICESCLVHWLYKRPEEFHVGEWLVTKGRTLLNKLNEDRQVSDDTSDQRLWDYYQALLKHYGFDGITDLLVKYRKLAEQVPEVVVPENMVELLTKAILFQDCGSHEGWEDNIDLGKAALKVFTASLMTTPSHSQQSVHPDDIAVDQFADVMKHKLAKARDKGRSGWESPSLCKVSDLAAMLVDHLPKGDPVDVANFAMMLFFREGGNDALKDVCKFINSQQSAKSGYAGVTVWVGDKTCTQIVSRLEIETSKAGELLRRFENAIHLISQSDRCPSHESEQEDQYPPPHVIDEWRTHCSCCPHCGNHPCDGVSAGGMCDNAECNCSDDYDSEQVGIGNG